MGDQPGGVVVAQTLNWAGQVLKTPRARLDEALARRETDYSGVYILLGEGAAYIGEADRVSCRVRDQAADKAWWTTAVLIIAGENKLDKAHIKYLESRLVQEARQVGRLRVINSVQPLAHGLGEAGRAEMESFIQELRFVLGALGVEAFTPGASPLGEGPGRNAAERPAPLAPDHPRIVRTEARLAKLTRISDLGMARVEEVSSSTPAAARAFERFSKAVRLTIAFEGRIEEEIARLLSGRALPESAPRAPAPRDSGPHARQEAPAEGAIAEYERLVETERLETFPDLSFAEALPSIREALDGGPERLADEPSPAPASPEPAAPPSAAPAQTAQDGRDADPPPGHAAQRAPPDP